MTDWKLLVPLGLLGLIGILILIIIYIIKPNYQQKFISSTFVWKLSLKYRKKRLPTSKWRNLIIIICQILMLALCALIISRPNEVLKAQSEKEEVVIVIDSSASMRTVNDGGDTRFYRAVSKAIDQALAVFDEDGVVSVILADESPRFIGERYTLDRKDQLMAEMYDLLDDSEKVCSYASSDMDKAMDYCQEIVDDNVEAKVYLYTDVTYEYLPSLVKVVSVTEEDEWNAAILNATAELEDNYYVFTINVACYGRDAEIEVSIQLHNVNAADKEDVGSDLSYAQRVYCDANTTKTVIFKSDSSTSSDISSEDVVYYYFDDTSIYSFDDAMITIEGSDSFINDNSFAIYGGQKEVVKVQYYSPIANNFVNGILYVLKNSYSDRWNIQITEVRADGEPATEGYDVYIFEHIMPEKMPVDGLVLLMDPDTAPDKSGLRIADVQDNNGRGIYLQEGAQHPITKDVNIDDITVSRYTQVAHYDADYEVLMTCNGKPVMLAKNSEDKQVVVMAFSLHYSNLAMLVDFPVLFANIFNYYLPSTVSDYSFEINSDIQLNCRGSQLHVSNNYDFDQTYESFPAVLKVSTPGSYTLEQVTYFGKEVTEYVYVRIPTAESNIWSTAATVELIVPDVDMAELYRDLMTYFALALVVLSFVEWILHSFEGSI